MEIIVQAYPDIGSLSDPARIKGRSVINTEWLIAYLQSGQADRLIVLLQGPSDQVKIEKEINRYGLSSSRCALKFCHVFDFPQLLRSLPEPIFFLGDPLIHSFKQSMRFLAPSRNIPVIGITHTLSTETIINGVQFLLMEKFDACDAIICTSRAAQEFLRRVWQEAAPKIKLTQGPLATPHIPLGIFPHRYRQIDKSFAATLPQGRPMVLVHGRITLFDKMDLISLIEHWPEIMDQTVNRPYLVISGSMKHMSTLETYQQRISALKLSDDISIMPNVTDAQRATLFQQAQLFCSPTDSLQETFGISVLEAMASECPVVISDWNGYRDLITDGNEGFLVPTYWGPPGKNWAGISPLISENQLSLYLAQQVSVDIKILADRLVRLLNDQELCREMGQRAKNRVEQIYAWPKVIAQYDKLFQKQLDLAKTTQVTHSEYSQPDLWEFFGHYPSRKVSNESRVRLTQKGEDILSKKANPFIFLNQPWHFEVLNDLTFSNRPEGKPIADIIAPLSADHHNKENAFSTILWMMKRGWLEIC